MNCDIVFYVNADGSGHAQRVLSILAHLKPSCLILTQDSDAFHALAKGRLGLHHVVETVPPVRTDDSRTLADDVLHLPYGRSGDYAERIARMATLCRDRACRLAVIDVCVETAMLMRLCGIPYVYMRMSGRRDDAAHLQAFRAAKALLASYPEKLEEDWTPDWVRAKTRYVGGLVTAPAKSGTAALDSDKPPVLVMRGKGDSSISASGIEKLAALFPDRQWIGVGFDEAREFPNGRVARFLPDIAALRDAADIVIANAGNNAVLEAGLARKKLIVLPEWRWFDEQKAKAEMLARNGLAILLETWPRDDDPEFTAIWTRVLNAADDLDPGKWQGVVAEDGARRAADWLAGLATQASGAVERI
jgi:UDP-N-acetylglucosamine--N-acetylmuramyl-(pentapeptide) pyrophosphoryl-undecaprenol N-acetylglucosamine transferase